MKRDLARFNAVAMGECELEDGEDIVEAHVLLSVAQALKSKDRVSWEKAISKEEARLLMFETWTAATDEEIASADRILPIAWP